jgi:CAAX prenyl protease-like protein
MVTAATRTFDTGARLSLAARAALLGLILFCEKFVLNFFVDFNAAQHATGFGAWVRVAQHGGFRFAVAFAVSLGLFAYARGDRRGWEELNLAAHGEGVRTAWVALHGLLVLPLIPLSYFLYGRSDSPLPFGALTALWLVFALAALWALATALARWSLWRAAARRLGVLWLYAAVAAAVAASAMQWSQKLWAPTAAVTFNLVWHVLVPFIPSLHADSHTLILSSSRFAVEVSPICSGLEGIGLLIAFCGAWLLCFRHEYRFPQALLLLPVGLALSFALNVARIAVLMLIGYAGYPAMAVYGFHSQAGWIAFNCVAGLIAFASRHVKWLNRTAPAPSSGPAMMAALAPAPALATASGTYPAVQGTADGRPAPAGLRAENPTAVYLLPFLMILAGGMLARALSSGFETLYVLRPAGAALALVWGWPRLRALNWRFSWRGILGGMAIFAVWVLFARLLLPQEAMPGALAAMSSPARATWLAVRIAATIITVPLAEELAFRGFLMRRIASMDFESVPFRQVGATALLISALAFGVEHTTMWLPGVLAGLVYGGLPMRTGRIGEAVIAHATTNALLVVCVLYWGQWQLLS